MKDELQYSFNLTMEEEMLSMISHAKLNMNEESSNSNCSIYVTNACKRSRVERFKGVVPQQNGHWGAQIYANHHRVWLGTFKSEIDAAMAYDSAAIKLRSGDTHRNFPWTNISIQEPKFQSHFTTDVVLNMIRDGSYPAKFADFLRSQRGEIEIGLNLSSFHGDGQFSCNLLFQKELTPSDVGKLNRLVIPKRYAVKHFPNVPDPSDHSLDIAGRVDEVQLEFYDRQMNLWKFRYCYWKSSQSFVFTRGWNRFVKEKGLRANDTIAFYMYESRDGRRFGQSFLVIDVASKDESRTDNTEIDLGRVTNNSDEVKQNTVENGKHNAFVEY
ncbi:UNVERIFIED_CONTAM: AP2/ERF and B3 domain-containing transcription factor [Sesamum angustifolium]|uniref:AP2/ERF and B3 domain-containing transcription factor n=1 Tax=Sesamum angustifolium TaxID=2727405 RepID=A0AAW2Q9E0_9LAMI